MPIFFPSSPQHVLSHNIYSEAIISKAWKQDRTIRLLDEIINKYFEIFKLIQNEKVKSRKVLIHNNKNLKSLITYRLVTKYYLRERYGMINPTELSNLKEKTHKKIKNIMSEIGQNIKKINEIKI